MSSEGARPELFHAAQAFLVDYLNYKGAEQLIITGDTAGDADVISALSAAAVAAGGRPLVMLLTQLPYQGKLADPYLSPALGAAVKASDVWVDVTFPYIAGSDMHAQCMAENHVRYMLASDLSADAMHRLFGRHPLDSYFPLQDALDKKLAAAVGAPVHITTPLGTDVRFQLGKPHSTRPRRAQTPGMYTIPGSCTLNPEIESVQGQIVVETVFHEYYTPLREPIVLDVEGRIRTLSGGGAERDVLDRALRRAGGDGDYGYIIHFTHGLHPGARFTGRCFVDDMRVPGCDAVGMGLPWWVAGGGENHPDAVMGQQSIWLDGELLVDRGQVVKNALTSSGS
jgi:2,5-dihydroxypyridine 5,6-dioxygenase